YLVEPEVGGAVTGTHLAVSGIGGLRYVMMFGLALATTGAYLALDTEVFRRRSPGESAGAAGREATGEGAP
ncbi:MAG: hypothetical protein GWN71_07460, partial [Gammaproteobacteria bacterium]|nr:hypothetical protein [Gemmatimonadota bacterium]NIU73411.1 hypothetical protein [Gammaproteobacteria bacterium]